MFEPSSVWQHIDTGPRATCRWSFEL